MAGCGLVAMATGTLAATTEAGLVTTLTGISEERTVLGSAGSWQGNSGGRVQVENRMLEPVELPALGHHRFGARQLRVQTGLAIPAGPLHFVLLVLHFLKQRGASQTGMQVTLGFSHLTTHRLSALGSHTVSQSGQPSGVQPNFGHLTEHRGAGQSTLQVAQTG